MTTNSWHKIAEGISDIHFSANGLTVMEVAGKTITIGRYNELIFACAQKCPHAGGILADGYIDAVGNLICPIHKYRFNLKNGRNISGEGYYLKTFVVELRENGVFINIPNQIP